MAKSTVNVDVQIQSKSIGKLETELQGINDQLKNAEIGSKAFTELSTKANGLTKELDKANSAAEGFTDDKKFMAADGAIKAMAGSVSGVVGALGLLGVESEAFGEMEKKAASAIAVSMGIKDVSEGFNQLRKSQILATTATKAYNLAVAAGNKIMKLLNITMALNPVGVLIAAFVTVGALVYAFRDQILNLIKTALGPFQGIIDRIYGAMVSLGEALGLVDDAQTKQTKANIERMEQELAVASAKGEATLQMEKDLLLEKRKLLEEGTDEYKDSVTAELVLDAQAVKQKEDIAKEAAAQAIQIQKDLAEKLDTEKKEQYAKELEEYKEHLRRMTDLDISNIEELGDIRSEFFEKNMEKAVTDEETRIELEREKQLLKIEELGLNEGLTRQTIAEVNTYYDTLETERLATRDEEILAAEEAMAAKKKQITMDSLQTASELFGQETALGKAALLAKQFLLAQELILNIKGSLAKGKKAVGDAVVTGAGASTEIAGSVGKAANTAPPPFNIPFILSAVATGAGILSSVKSAIGATKQAAGQGGGAGGVGITAPNVGSSLSSAAYGPAAASLPPQPSTANSSVRAYVVSGDVSSSQEADARLDRRRSLG